MSAPGIVTGRATPAAMTSVEPLVSVTPAVLVDTAVRTLVLALVGIVARRYQLESPAFIRTFMVITAAYPVVTVLRPALRQGAFVLASLVALVLVMGSASVWVLGIGAGLIAACHLPIAFRWRVLVLLGLGSLLAFARAGSLPSAIPAAVWAVAGAMFMFRIILYAQAVGQGERAPVTTVLAYFFMLPNAVFPLYPIVDFKGFVSSWRSAPDAAVAQRGVTWIVRGVVHLLAYRLIYHNAVMESSAIASLGSLVQALLATFFLYLKVSGQFHVIVGALLLFGWNLPETHHLYVLSSSYSDLWRRINIYWKDFMMKVVYYPAYFRLRKFGHRRALLLATALVFVATWVLHAYQWFWLLGGALLTVPDTLFWTILGALVVGQAWFDTRGGARPRRTNRWSLRRGTSVALTFFGLLVLWTMWSAESMGEFFAIWPAALHASPVEIVVVVLLVAAFVVYAGFPWGERALAATIPSAPTLKTIGPPLAVVLALLALSLPQARAPLGPVAQGILGSLADPQLNAKDLSDLNRGYYEDLTRGNKLAGATWGLKTDKPADWIDLRETGAVERRDDMLLETLRPNVQQQYHGKPFRTNSFGMRDQEYALAKTPNTLRIALLGPSDVMGSGVGDDETFDALLERRLDALAQQQGRRVEVLNFAVEGYSLLQQRAMLEQRVLAWQPDVVLSALHEVDPIYFALTLQRATERGIVVPWADVAAIAARAGITSTMDVSAVRRRIAGDMPALYDAALGGMASALDSVAARRAVLLMREPTTRRDAFTLGRASASRFGYAVIDLQDAYRSTLESTFRLAQWDRHPNARGHAALATALGDALLAPGDPLHLGLSSPSRAP
ncbi:MAG: hypothetical protein LCH84_14820 [Gemmatimonadetes bacterium]|nr:hypothetical protein [Gemmatimonadota bacterium]